MMNAIVAVSQNWGIGRDNNLLFSLPTDMKRFRTLTAGHTVVMGRNTLLSLPGARPLPKRRNLVLSATLPPAEGLEIVRDIPSLLTSITDKEEVWVMGGSQVYTALLPYCRKVVLTRVYDTPTADSFFPDLDALGWRPQPQGEPLEENGLRFAYIDYLNPAFAR